MAGIFMERGYDVVSKGTDDHLFLVSFIKQGLTGKDVEAWLGADPQSPFVTSGIRVGTPAITTRGLGESDARELAGWMCDLIDSRGDQATIDGIKTKALEICARHPVYG